MKGRSRLLSVIGAFFCFLFLVMTVMAAEQSQKIMTDISGDELANILKSLNIEPKVLSDGDGDPLIKISLGGRIDSIDAIFVFYDKTTEGRYSDLQLFTAFRFSSEITGDKLLKRVNEFNRRKRLSKVYVDKDGDVIMDTDLALSGGVTEKSIKVLIENFEARFFDIMSIIHQ